MLFLFCKAHSNAGADNSIVRDKQKTENSRIINENIRTKCASGYIALFRIHFKYVERRNDIKNS